MCGQNQTLIRRIGFSLATAGGVYGYRETTETFMSINCERYVAHYVLWSDHYQKCLSTKYKSCFNLPHFSPAAVLFLDIFLPLKTF